MAYFTHHFETMVVLHPVGLYNYTVVFLDADLHDSLPFKESPRLRIEADISGVPVKGAWQPSHGRWYLTLPKTPIKKAGIGIGSVVEVAFKLLPQDEVDVPPELSDVLESNKKTREAWAALSAGKQRGLAYMIASAKRPETKNARVDQVTAVLLGKAVAPWVRK
jgi:hypothetical protein